MYQKIGIKKHNIDVTMQWLKKGRKVLSVYLVKGHGVMLVKGPVSPTGKINGLHSSKLVHPSLPVYEAQSLTWFNFFFFSAYFSEK
jgi:hypothetical protein